MSNKVLSSASVKKFFRNLSEALIVSRCPSCGALTKHSGTFCESCLALYAAEIKRKCDYCSFPAAECVCSTRELKYCTDFGASMYSHVFYVPENKVFSSALYMLKKNPDRNAEKLFARELSAELSHLAALRGVSPDEWCITFPPRGRASLVRYGFDQSKGMAKRISRLCGMTFEDVFLRHGSYLQKELDAAARHKNAKKSFSIRKNADVRGKKYVIVDDVITTGATVGACEELLYSAGAASVFVISLAKTPLRGKGYDREEKKKRKPKNDNLWFNE